MDDYTHREMLALGPDETSYRLLTTDHVSTGTFEGQEILKVEPAGLTMLADQAVRDSAHLLRTSHLEQVRRIYDDPEASDNDRFVALELLKNANIAAGWVLPMCQDTGTAIVTAKKGNRVWTDGNDEAALSLGIKNAYEQTNLRYSQMAPLTMYVEVNTRTNLPAQIEIYTDKGDAYKLMFISKGGGSANKSFLFQETRALLNPSSLRDFIDAKLRMIGTAACPPYHLAIVIGGTSAEYTLKLAKMASTRFLDSLPTQGNEYGQAFRDLEMEAEVLKMSQEIGIGAQFGGKYFCHDVRIVRLPRHGASCPVGIAVSCSADRQVLAKITAKGIFLEELETDPARFMPELDGKQEKGEQVDIDLNRPMQEVREELTKYPVSTRLSLSGRMIVARDIAHAKLKERLDSDEGLPEYFREQAVYYAGPAKTPEGHVTGSFGPTTAGRMDSYVDVFQAVGGSMVMLAKGNRSQQVTDACKKHGGFYLGSVGGPAARLAQDCITKVEVLEYAELGMEAIWQIEVKDFPAVIIVDDKGNDFFAAFRRP
jgi:fumarate hydratase class I